MENYRNVAEKNILSILRTVLIAGIPLVLAAVWALGMGKRMDRYRAEQSRSVKMIAAGFADQVNTGYEQSESGVIR